MLTLGAQPLSIAVLIPRTGSFSSALVNDEGDWPVGAGIELRFDREDAAPIVWPAVIDGAEARWDRTAIECAAVLALHRPPVTLVYTSGASEVLWGRGRVSGV